MGDFFTDYNKDAVAGGSFNDVSQGPKLGFLDSFSKAYNDDYSNHSQYGLSQNFHDTEQAQIQKMRRAGVAPHPSLDDQEKTDEISVQQDMGMGVSTANTYNPRRRYFDAADYYANGGTPEQADMLAKRNAQIEALRKQYPDLGLQTYDEMYAQIRKDSEKAQDDWANGRTSLTGMLGGVLGGAAAGADPRVNPLGFVSMFTPAGAEGFALKAAATRLAVQAGAQGAASAAAQFDIQANRRALGMPSGFDDAAKDVLGAVVGGAIGQGVLEPFVAGFGRWKTGRWFTDAPHDRAPPAPADTPSLASGEKGVVLPPDAATGRPFTAEQAAAIAADRERYDLFYKAVQDSSKDILGVDTRAATAKTILNLDYVKTQLDDWKGPAPGEVRPLTAAGSYADRLRFDNYNPMGGDLDAMARAADPETFARWDKIQAQMAELRNRIHESGPAGTQDAGTRAADAIQQQQDLIDTKRAQLEGLKGKRRGRLEDEIAQLEQQMIETQRANKSHPREEMRAQLMELDKDARDLGPLMAQARAAAKGEWYAAPRSSLADQPLVPKPRDPVEALIERHPNEVFPLTPRDAIQARVASMPEAVNKLPADASTLEKVNAALDAHQKIVDADTDRFARTITRLGKSMEGDDAKATQELFKELTNGERSLQERISVEGADGKIKETTLGEHIAELHKDNEAAQAVGTCSAR